MTDNARPSADEPLANESEPAPELVDWWVWGVRNIAGVVGDLLLAARGVIVLIALVKLGTWYFTRNDSDLYQAGSVAVGFVAAWGIGILLGRFAWSRETPDPMRWRRRQRRR